MYLHIYRKNGNKYNKTIAAVYSGYREYRTSFSKGSETLRNRSSKNDSISIPDFFLIYTTRLLIVI